jgi:8-oxo-dGTP pyrophosphatase MutT (NUDIX family)
MFIASAFIQCGPGSSVGIASDYGMDGPGSNPGGDEIFRPSRPALGPTKPPENGYLVFPGGKVRPGRAADRLLSSSATVMEE